MAVLHNGTDRRDSSISEGTHVTPRKNLQQEQQSRVLSTPQNAEELELLPGTINLAQHFRTVKPRFR